MINIIKSKDNNKIKHLTSLKEGKYRHQYQEFIAEGYKSLEMALKNHQVKEVYSITSLDNIPSDVPQYLISEDILKKIAFSKNPEGVVFVCDFLKQMLQKLNKVVYLDHVNDPGNMGTIIRTALAFNYDAVIVSSESCDIYNEKVIAASKGAIFAIPVFTGELKDYATNREVIVSMLDDSAIDIRKIKVPESFILVVGNEAHGVSRETIALATIKTKIEIHNIDSLNVSIATGILMDHLR